MRYFFCILIFFVFHACTKTEDKTPECRVTKVSRAGLEYSVTYRGDTVIEIGSNTDGTKLFFNKAGRMERVEEPIAEPNMRRQFTYNNSGRVMEQTTYFKEGNGWVYKAKMSFNYTGEKITNIREESTFNTSGTVYDYDVVWEGENVRSITTRIGSDIVCTRTFSYDNSRENKMRQYDFMYFGDGDLNQVSYTLPFYFSKNLLAQSTAVCPTSETLQYDYSLTDNGQVQTFMVDGANLWTFQYDCR